MPRDGGVRRMKGLLDRMIIATQACCSTSIQWSIPQVRTARLRIFFHYPEKDIDADTDVPRPKRGPGRARP